MSDKWKYVRHKIVIFSIFLTIIMGGLLTQEMQVQAATVKRTTITTTTSVNYKSIRLKWKKVVGAKGYVVYRSTKAGSGYKKIKTITSGKTTSYVDRTAKTGVKYYYKIKVYKKINGKVFYSKFSKAKAGKSKLTKPILKVTVVNGSIRLTAAKRAGIQGYVIARSTSNKGTYKTIKTLRTTKALSYTDVSAKNNNTYYYKVRTYRIVNKKRVYSAFSAVRSGIIKQTVEEPTEETTEKKTEKPTEETTENVTEEITTAPAEETETGISLEDATVQAGEESEIAALGEVGKDYYILSEESTEIPGVSIENNIVTITEDTTLLLEGDYTNYQFACNTKKLNITLILNGVTLSNGSTSAICSEKGSTNVVLELVKGSVNKVLGATEYPIPEGETEPEPDAAIYVDGNLNICGEGMLIVEDTSANGDAIKCKSVLEISEAMIKVTANDDGIVGKEGLIINSGILDITSLNGDGLKSNIDEEGYDGVVIKGGSVKISAKDDGVQADVNVSVEGGVLDITSEGKGIKAATKVEDESGNVTSSYGCLTISGGTIIINSVDDALHSNHNITVNGGIIIAETDDDGVHADVALTISDGNIRITDSYEGIEAAELYLQGGTIYANASDDGINAAGGVSDSTTTDSTDQFRPGNGGMTSETTGTLQITGGNITVDADGDGIDVNGDFNMTGGTVIVYGPTNDGNGALDYDGTFKISGGTLLAFGSVGMSQSPSDSSTQYALSANVGASQLSGTVFKILDSTGNVVIQHTVAKEYQSVVVSSPLFRQGAAYTVMAGNTSVGTVTFTSINMTLGSSSGSQPGSRPWR